MTKCYNLTKLLNFFFGYQDFKDVCYDDLLKGKTFNCKRKPVKTTN